MNSKPTIVILRALALGDFLTGLPALRAIKRAFPEHHRILTCPTWLKPLVEYTDAADEIIDGAYFENGKFEIPTNINDRMKLEQAQLNGLKIKQRPDIAINLRGQRTALHKALLALKPNKYIGYFNPEIPETKDSPIWEQDEYEVQKWCRLLNAFNISANVSDYKIAKPTVSIFNCIKNYVIIHPGAGSSARLWPIERWAEVANWEIKNDKNVIITGSKEERIIALRVAEIAKIPTKNVLAGETNILELIYLCSQANHIISTDTGIAHIAFALNIPSVTIFGPMPPSRWGPPCNNKSHLILWAGIQGEPYSSIPDRGLLKITVKDVINKLIYINKN
jgi:ADP-heptose:LPS heptosyltransferase